MNDSYYLATHTCGFMLGATVDDPDHAKDVAKNIASWVRNGATISRHTNEPLPTGFCQCFWSKKRKADYAKYLATKQEAAS